MRTRRCRRWARSSSMRWPTTTAPAARMERQPRRSRGSLPPEGANSRQESLTRRSLEPRPNGRLQTRADPPDGGVRPFSLPSPGGRRRVARKGSVLVGNPVARRPILGYAEALCPARPSSAGAPSIPSCSRRRLNGGSRHAAYRQSDRICQGPRTARFHHDRGRIHDRVRHLHRLGRHRPPGRLRRVAPDGLGRHGPPHGHRGAFLR